MRSAAVSFVSPRGAALFYAAAGLLWIVVTDALVFWLVARDDLRLVVEVVKGFVFVVLGRSELFTEHTTLAVLPVIDRRSPVSRLARLWGLVYAGNVVGGVVFALFAVVVGPSLDLFDPATVKTAVEPFTKHGPGPLFGGALLAGWLMGLLSWLVAAGRDTISRIFFVWLVTAVIGFLHLPHCIAGTIEMTAALATGAVGPLAFLEFMVVATLGNAVGGTIFVGLLKYGHVVRGNESDEVAPLVSDD